MAELEKSYEDLMDKASLYELLQKVETWRNPILQEVRELRYIMRRCFEHLGVDRRTFEQFERDARTKDQK